VKIFQKVSGRGYFFWNTLPCRLWYGLWLCRLVSFDDITKEQVWGGKTDNLSRHCTLTRETGRCIISQPCVISRSIRQGCPLSPLLFNVYMYAEELMKTALENCRNGMAFVATTGN